MAGRFNRVFFIVAYLYGEVAEYLDEYVFVQPLQLISMIKDQDQMSNQGPFSGCKIV